MCGHSSGGWTPDQPDGADGDLSVGERQLVEQIAKALSEDIRILVLDEPTAALPEKDVASLFSIVRRLAASGVARLFISHRLDEVFEIGHRVTILRDGRKVATEPIEAITRERLIYMMVGHEVGSAARQAQLAGDVALEVRGMAPAAFSEVSFWSAAARSSARRPRGIGRHGCRSHAFRHRTCRRRRDADQRSACGASVGPADDATRPAFVPEDRQGAGPESC